MTYDIAQRPIEVHWVLKSDQNRQSNKYFPLFLGFRAVPSYFLVTGLAFASVRVFACFVPLVFVVLRFGFHAPTLEAFLRFRFGHIRLDSPFYDRSSEATLATFPVVMFVVQILGVRFVKLDGPFTVWTCV